MGEFDYWSRIYMNVGYKFLSWSTTICMVDLFLLGSKDLDLNI